MHQSRVVEVVSAPALNKSRQVSSRDSWSNVGFSPFSTCSKTFSSGSTKVYLGQEDVEEVPRLVGIPCGPVLLYALPEHCSQLPDDLDPSIQPRHQGSDNAPPWKCVLQRKLGLECPVKLSGSSVFLTTFWHFFIRSTSNSKSGSFCDQLNNTCSGAPSTFGPLGL